MKVWFYKLLMDILLWILRLLDGLFSIFRQLAGMDTVSLETGESVSLIDYFMQADAVTQIFWTMVMISVLIIAVSIIVSVVKNIINFSGGEQKSHVRTVGQGLGSLFVTLAMAAIMIGGIAASNEVLKYVDAGFEPDMTISQRIIELSVEEGWEIDTGNSTKLLDADGNFVYDEDGNLEYSEIVWKKVESGWRPGKGINDINITTATADTIFGDYKNWMGVFPREDKYNGGGVIRIDSFNFLIAYISGIALIVVLLSTMLGLVKRLYDLVVLFIALPLISGTIALNDGAYMKLWRETVISKVILVYGAVISVNVFLLLMNLIAGINFTSMGLSGSILKLVLMVGGGLSISGGQLLFARLFGTSAEESREMGQAFRTAVGIGGGILGVGAFIKRAAVGGVNKQGGASRGALGLVGKGLDTTGKLLGGNAYTGLKGNIASGSSNLSSVLRGGFMKAGGIGGLLGGTAIRDNNRANAYANTQLAENEKARASYAARRSAAGKTYTPRGPRLDKSYYKKEYHVRQRAVKDAAAADILRQKANKLSPPPASPPSPPAKGGSK